MRLKTERKRKMMMMETEREKSERTRREIESTEDDKLQPLEELENKDG
jgi:hypothetical protein